MFHTDVNILGVQMVRIGLHQVLVDMTVDVVSGLPQLVGPEWNVGAGEIKLFEDAPQDHLVEIRCYLFHRVVISDAQSLPPAQTTDYPMRNRAITHRKIPQVPNMVAGFHDLIPIIDHPLVHFVDGVEFWPDASSIIVGEL